MGVVETIGIEFYTWRQTYDCGAETRIAAKIDEKSPCDGNRVIPPPQLLGRH